jgi:hypothetical protein
MEGVLTRESIIATSEKIMKRAMENSSANGKFNEFVNEEKERIKNSVKKFSDILTEDHCKKEQLEMDKLVESKLLGSAKNDTYDKDLEAILKNISKCFTKYEAYCKPLEILKENLNSSFLVDPHLRFFNRQENCFAYFVLDDTKEKELYQCMMKCWDNFLLDFKDYTKDIRDMVDVTFDDLKNKKI